MCASCCAPVGGTHAVRPLTKLGARPLKLVVVVAQPVHVRPGDEERGALRPVALELLRVLRRLSRARQGRVMGV
eukprot:7388140-Prymnesium_polylepis.1